MIICKRCEKPFELATTLGRPRQICYDCKPIRKKRDGVQRSAVQEPATTVGKHAGTQEAARLTSVHCRECSSFTTGEPFCNPRCRARFAERVADAKRGHPASMTSSKRGRTPGSHMQGRKPLARLREDLNNRIADERNQRKTTATRQAA